MAHMIDETTGVPAIAYAGETPWHGLGQIIEKDDDIATITRKAGLAWEVLRTSVQFEVGEQKELMRFKGRDVLYRGDTKKPLGVVGKDYKIVQPEQVMGFFEKLISIGGFTMETAGALSDGKRIRALAKISDGCPIVGHDIVKPYMLATTSYDGTMATTAKLTNIRAVCNNTLTAALYEFAEHGSKGVATTVKVPHSLTFDPDQVRKEMGVFANSFEKWVIQTKILAAQQLTVEKVASMTAKLIATTLAKPKEGAVMDVTASKGYKRVMELFDGGAIGSDMGGTTKWGFINAVTQWIDHERGTTQESRLNSAWFGDGERVKNLAYQLAVETD